MADIDELIAPITESQIWTSITRAFDAASVAWRAWGTRNAFLVVSQWVKVASAQLTEANRQVVRGQFLQMGQGLALSLFAKSQYQLDKQPAQFAIGRVLIYLSPSVGPVSISASQLHAGTPGPVTAASRLFTSLSAMILQPDEYNVVDFSADVAGDQHNLPVGSPFELKSSVAGAAVSINATGEPTRIGSGNASLILYSNGYGVSIEFIDPGAPNIPIDVTGNLLTSVVTVTLPTDGASALYATATTVRKAIALAANYVVTVRPLLIACSLGGDGSGIVQPAALTALPFLGQWLTVYGKQAQDDESLAEDCANRWDTLGGASGDGVPVSDAQTDSALLYWAKRPPAGTTVSPVTRARVYSNLDDLGNIDGSAALVLLAGQAGALTPADVAAVAANFENPQKYSYGVTLRVKSVTNYSVAVTGTVRVRLSSGRTLAQVQQAVVDAFIAYARKFDLIGVRVEPSVITAIVVDADRDAISRFEQTAPVAAIQLAFNEFAVFDLSALAYAYV